MPSQKVTGNDLLLAARIKRWRSRAKMTQQQLADKTRLSLTFIGLLETAKRKPSLKTLNKLAAALDVKVRDLLPY